MNSISLATKGIISPILFVSPFPEEQRKDPDDSVSPRPKIIIDKIKLTDEKGNKEENIIITDIKLI
jgi:hypothetical protein